ncbi:MAG: hypothetical protein HUK25_00600 [Treponema sp.]|nr:hypothetical protein [Treponema sp.]
MKRKRQKESDLHWSEQKETVSSSRPIKLLLSLLKHLPNAVVNCLAYPVAFFYYLFSKRGRHESRVFQKKLKEFTNGEVPKIISPYKSILSFSIAFLEKLAGWLGKIEYDQLITHDDDCQELIERLEQGKGALLFTSHLGNSELLRSLTSFNRTGVSKAIPVNVLMEIHAAEIFFQTLKEVNPGFTMNTIDTHDIGPETIEHMQECIDRGELVVVAGDRTAATSKERFLRKKFLGQEADFPYGVYLIATLLEAPVYYIFGLRDKTTSINSKNHMYVERSKIDLNCTRKERENKINALCDEFISKIEHYCIQYPYQWYNFYNFWLLSYEKD